MVSILCAFLHSVHLLRLVTWPYNMLPAAAELDLKKNGDGFLSNVAQAQSNVSGVNITAAPAVDSKPLGFYFSKDIPGHVKEKALGIRSSTESSKPVDGKAAMSLYFNKEKPEGQGTDAASEVQREQTSKRKTFVQESNIDGQQSKPQRAAGLPGTSSNSQHRKALRGISKGIQTGQAVGFESNVSATNAVNRSSDPLSVALNFSSVQTDDM